MDDDLSDLRNRQTRTERRMTDLEAKVDEQAGLRAKMDEELGTVQATLNAHTQSLNALQEVQGDHTRRLTRIEGRLGNVEGRLGNVEESLVTVRVGVHAIVDLLNANLAKKSLAGRLAARFARHRDAA